MTDAVADAVAMPPPPKPAPLSLSIDTQEDLKYLRDQARKYTESLERRIADLEAQLLPDNPQKNGEVKTGSVAPSEGLPSQITTPVDAKPPQTPATAAPNGVDKNGAEKDTKPSEATNDVDEKIQTDTKPSETSGANGDDKKEAEKDKKPPQYKIVYSEEGEDKEESERAKIDAEKKKKEAESELAFTYRKFLGREPARPEVVLGARMCTLLRNLLPHFPDHIFDDADPKFSSPFEVFIHNWDLLKTAVAKEVEEPLEKQDLENLKALMNIMSTNSGDTKLEAYFKTREANTAAGKITYDNVWTLFPPGELVMSKPYLDQEQFFLVQGNYLLGWPITESKRRKVPPAWIVVCWAYDWDGSSFERKGFEFKIEKFSGARSINTLNLFPVSFYKDPKVEGGSWEASLKKKLMDRGRRFREICIAKRGSRMFEYDGIALSRGRGLSAQASTRDDPPWLRSSSDSRTTIESEDYWDDYNPQALVPAKKSRVKDTVMVDFEAYFQQTSLLAPLGGFQPTPREVECGCSTCQKNDVLKDKLKFDYDNVKAEVPPESWQDEQWLICPPRVMGYSMRDGHWLQLQVDLVKTPDKNDEDDTFDHKLTLDPNTKKIIKDLVVNHESGKKRAGKPSKGLEDLVDEKGKGLVMLFHGPPGVGKTLTAESVAKSAGKPLLSIGVSDIGLKSDVAEKNLRRVFDLATEWEAVILLDEADVFLNSRGQGETNLEKNALVSVLLRVLEYYEGILILTTNRINSFDVAVQSRVHLAVKYQNLDAKQINKIYTTFLQQIKDENNIDDWKAMQRWVAQESKRSDFNGRQIRNIVSAALGLARAGNEKLNTEHLDEIVEKTTGFHKELERQRQAYEAKQLAGGQWEK